MLLFLLAMQGVSVAQSAPVPPIGSWDQATSYPAGARVTLGGQTWQALRATGGERPGSDLALPAPQGFGARTIGGAGGEVRLVTSLAFDGPGSLQAAISRPGPAIVRFAVDGTIHLSRRVKAASFLTIDARDRNVTISGEGLYVQGQQQVIFAGLRFAHQEGPADGLTILDGSRHVWVYDCSFREGEDGLIDIKRGATDITVSHSRFSDHDKVMLIVGDSVLKPSRVTLHHNVFERTNQRNPRVLYGLVHAYNNYLQGWTGFGMQSADGGQLLTQNNVFAAARDRDAAISRGVVLGALRSAGDLLTGGAIILTYKPESVFTPPYKVIVEPATTTLAARLSATAGQLPTTTAWTAVAAGS